VKIVYDGREKDSQSVKECEKRPAWVNQDVECPKCYSIFVLEVGDKVTRIGSRDEALGSMGTERLALWRVPCPICNEAVEFTAGLV